MFDLFRSRAKAVRYLLGAILLVVALSMVITLIPGFVGAGYDQSDDVIAEVGDEVLTARDAQLIIQQQLRSGEIPREMVANYVPLIVDQMIMDRAVAYQARRMGFQVTDSELAQAVQSMMPQLFPNGEFVGKEIYQQYLSQMNMSIPEFESRLRSQMLKTRLSNIALEGEVISEKEIEAEFRRKNEKIQLEYVSIAPAEYRSEVKPTAAELLAYYEEHKGSYKTPEERDIDLVVINQRDVASTAIIPEDQLLRAYQSNLDRFRFDERVKVRHILLKTTDKSEADKQKAKQLADELLKKIRGGADFAALAKQYSEDVGTAQVGGDLGSITKGQTVPSFENAAFSLKPGETSGVISTEYGYHIIQVLEKEQPRQEKFEDVRDQLASEMKKQFVYDKMQSLAETVEQELTKNPAGGEQIAKQHGFQFRQLKRFKKGDSIPALSQNSEALDTLASLAKSAVTPVMQGGEDSLAVATVTEVYPARSSEFSEAESRVTDSVKNRKAAEIANQKTEELTRKMKESGADLTKVAREMGLEIKKSEEMTLDAPAGELGSSYFYRQGFEKPVGAVIGPVNAPGRLVFARVIRKIPADPSQLPAQRGTLSLGLKRQKAQLRQRLFEDGILTSLIEQGKVKINERARDRLLTVYQQSAS